MHKSGIYIIKNVIDNRIYVGSTTCLKRRIRDHKSSLKSGTHFNNHLQFFVAKYGIEAIYFEILENCALDELVMKEQYWIALLNPSFNYMKVADNKLVHSEETKLKMSIQKKGKPSHRRGVILSDEAKQNMSKARIGKKYGPRKPHTQETKDKISKKVKALLIGNKRTLGRKCSEETRKKISESLIGNTYRRGKKFGKINRTYTDEQRSLIAERMKVIMLGNKRSLGVKHTEEFKNKKSQSMKGNTLRTDWLNKQKSNEFV